MMPEQDMHGGVSMCALQAPLHGRAHKPLLDLCSGLSAPYPTMQVWQLSRGTLQTFDSCLHP